jgi:hypothetical protein
MCLYKEKFASDNIKLIVIKNRKERVTPARRASCEDPIIVQNKWGILGYITIS